MCFFLLPWVLLPESPLPLVLEPVLPELLSEPVEPVEPLDPVRPVEPAPGFVVLPDCADAAPAASIEITATLWLDCETGAVRVGPLRGRAREPSVARRGPALVTTSRGLLEAWATGALPFP